MKMERVDVHRPPANPAEIRRGRPKWTMTSLRAAVLAELTCGESLTKAEIARRVGTTHYRNVTRVMSDLEQMKKNHDLIF